MNLFIAGYPCTGKTTFGNWLRDHRGYLHIDLESDDFNRSCLHSPWERSLERRDMGAFASEANLLHPRVVVTWGFPHSHAWTAESFQKAGVRLAWFDAEPNACRRAWDRRGTGTIKDLDRQLSALAAHRADFVAAFTGNVINVLPRPDQRMDTLDIAKAIGLSEPRT